MITERTPGMSKSAVNARRRKEREAADRYENSPCLRCGLARINVLHHVTPEQQAWAGDSGYFDDVDTHKFTEVPA